MATSYKDEIRNGTIQANMFIKNGGTSSQILLANGNTLPTSTFAPNNRVPIDQEQSFLDINTTISAGDLYTTYLYFFIQRGNGALDQSHIATMRIKEFNFLSGAINFEQILSGIAGLSGFKVPTKKRLHIYIENISAVSKYLHTYPNDIDKNIVCGCYTNFGNYTPNDQILRNFEYDDMGAKIECWYDAPIEKWFAEVYPVKYNNPDRYDYRWK